MISVYNACFHERHCKRAHSYELCSPTGVVVACQSDRDVTSSLRGGRCIMIVKHAGRCVKNDMELSSVQSLKP